MKKWLNGQIVEMSEIEIEELEASAFSLTYEQRIVSRIRQKYSVDDELAILRQRDSKPEEFSAYNEFVEKIKAEEKGGITDEFN